MASIDAVLTQQIMFVNELQDVGFTWPSERPLPPHVEQHFETLTDVWWSLWGAREAYRNASSTPVALDDEPMTTRVHDPALCPVPGSAVALAPAHRVAVRDGRQLCGVCGVKRKSGSPRWLKGATHPHVPCPADRMFCQRCYNKYRPVAPQILRWRSWLEMGRVRFYDTGSHGRGVRALQSISLADLTEEEKIVAHIGGPSLSQEEYDALDDVAKGYMLDTSLDANQPRNIDLRRHWTGSINHASPGSANVKFEAMTLVQVADIQAGQPLLVDYGMGYWVHALTGIDVEEWRRMPRRKAPQRLLDAFATMHETVDDYGPLLTAGLSTDADVLLRRLEALVPALRTPRRP